MSLSKADLEALGGLIDSKIAAAVGTPSATQEAPAPQKATGTAKKAATIKRNLDPVEVAGSGDVTFKVIASNGGGPITKGARVIPFLDGKKYQSLDDAMIESLTPDVIGQLRAAIATVNKRALLGEHAPAKVATQA